MITRRLWLVANVLFLGPISLHAQGIQTIEIEKVQLAQSLAATVHDAAGSPIAGAVVEEFAPGWKRLLRSAKTDGAGVFTLAPVKGRDLYYLQLRSYGFNPLRVRVRVDRKRGKELHLQMEVSN